MSFEILREVRDAFINDANITALVPATKIRVGWQESVTTFPSIIISTVTETETGQLGYAHNKRKAVLTTIQVDILSRKSLQNAVEIADAVSQCMLELGWEKVGDLDTFDTLMKCHRKTLRFSSIRYVE